MIVGQAVEQNSIERATLAARANSNPAQAQALADDATGELNRASIRAQRAAEAQAENARRRQAVKSAPKDWASWNRKHSGRRK